MKALVLGATGFIGSHVARALLSEGRDVRVLSRGSGPALALEGLSIERVIGDLNDRTSLEKALKGCDVLFHVAGYYPLYSDDRERQTKTALTQMTNVLEAAAEAGLKRIVYTSSMSTIGKNSSEPNQARSAVEGEAPSGFARGGGDASPSNEDTPYDPKDFRGLYYQIKYLQEQSALAAAAKGLPLVIVNPTGVFGDYDVKPTSGAIVVALAKGRLPFLFDAKCNVVDARDVARGQVAAMKKGKSGRRYILGSHNTTFWEIAKLVTRIAKVRPPRGRLPLAFGEAAAHVSEVMGRLFRQEKPLLPLVGIDFLKYGMHYDTTRAKTELGFTSVPLEETFERAIGWFRKNNSI